MSMPDDLGFRPVWQQCNVFFREQTYLNLLPRVLCLGLLPFIFVVDALLQICLSRGYYYSPHRMPRQLCRKKRETIPKHKHLNNDPPIISITSVPPRCTCHLQFSQAGGIDGVPIP